MMDKYKNNDEHFDYVHIGENQKNRKLCKSSFISVIQLKR